MNIPGPLSVSAITFPHQQELDLRPFQRVTAQVLSVTGTTALLTIEGYPIVAQLASADQASTLLSRQTAHFIVTQRTSEKITLKVLSDEQTQSSLARPVFPGTEVATRLLEQANIPVTANHLVIARAILKKHLPVTPLLLNEISETLAASGSWGNKEAELAAALKAAGLPLNPQSLALASRQAAQIGDAITRLVAKLTNMAGQDLPEEICKQLESNLQVLKSLVLRADSDPSQLAGQLEAAVKMLGRSLENIALEEGQNHGAFSKKNLLSLVRLQQSLEHAGKKEFASIILDVLNDLQHSHFLNAKTEPIPGQGQWTEIGFAIQNMQPGEDESFSCARLRIAPESGSASGKINPAYTRLILQVDVNPELTVEVDLSVVDQQMRASITMPNPGWCQQAREELPVLEQALQELGFTLKDTQIKVGEPNPFERLTTSETTSLMTVDIEA
jgi:hypothetical protein